MSFSVPASRQPLRRPWTMEELVRGRNIALGLATDASSRWTYSSHLNSYVAFCSMHNFPLDPTPDTLSFFIVYMSHHIEPQSVGNYLSGICNRLEIYFPEVRSNRLSPLMSKTLQGMKKLCSKPTRRKLPLSRDHLLCTQNSLIPSSSHDEVLFVAMLVTGTCGLLRLGELVIPDDPRLRNSRKIIQRESVELIEEDGFAFSLPFHKADRTFEALAEDGAAPHVIQAIGRWSSETFQIYIHHHPVILHAFLNAHRGRTPTSPSSLSIVAL
ncbi:hypothetical protein GYMLUDRAFT_164754 [Collybiopsis luxurians FD-317 M1]|uniref:Uncharacterized protein n=1 Tax=Collybiopsis luxurians FD-317 M1 TaxID=944289 RepID=A0A0D0CT78_9AGAR|nr:hypothetical protein GYMLUDRAFT_164754 [Collybiopsis luxurians FD-317 M1]